MDIITVKDSDIVIEIEEVSPDQLTLFELPSTIVEVTDNLAYRLEIEE